MKLLKCLCLIALVSMMYSCSNNIMNDEDPGATLKAEQAETSQNSTEFVKSEHIAGYLDAQAKVLYIMPEYQEITLQRLGAATLGTNKYEISKEHAEGAVTRQEFSIVNVKERAMLYKLATIRDYEQPGEAIADGHRLTQSQLKKIMSFMTRQNVPKSGQIRYLHVQTSPTVDRLKYGVGHIALARPVKIFA